MLALPLLTCFPLTKDLRSKHSTYTFYIGSTPTFLYFDLYLNTAYIAHYVSSNQHISWNHIVIFVNNIFYFIQYSEILTTLFSKKGENCPFEIGTAGKFINYSKIVCGTSIPIILLMPPILKWNLQKISGLFWILHSESLSYLLFINTCSRKAKNTNVVFEPNKSCQ